ncbi:MAG: hypothetical protein RLY31_2004 [Bacteroidota bacterium]|jgi:hypothetical protein
MLQKCYFLSVFLLSAAWLSAQTPANDQCDQAADVQLGETVSFNTVEATTDGPLHPNSPCPSSTNDTLFRDIWYRFTATESGLVDWSLCGTADYDTKIAVYKGGATCPLADDDLLTCNDDFGTCIGNTSRIIFSAEAGQSYLLRLGGWGETDPGEAGTGTFTLSTFTASLPNDFCDLAIDIPLVTGYSFTNVDATTDGPQQPNNSACFGFGDPNVQADIWYRFTATLTGTVEWSTCDQINFDSRLAVYGPGASCTPSADQLYACNDDGSGCSFYTSRVLFDVVEGETYLLRLGGWNGDQGTGTFDLLEVIPPTPPSNDLCAQPDSAWIVTAEQADDFDNPVVGTTVNATFDQDDFIFPNAQCFGTNTAGGEFADVWYWFNTYGNETLEFRFLKGNDQPTASFYLDMFDACNEPVDTNVVFGSCIFMNDASPSEVTTVSGLPDVPTVYLLRVTTRLTTQLPGDYFFFIVGEVTEPPVSTSPVFPGRTFLHPNPANQAIWVDLQLDAAAEIRLDVVNAFGQRVRSTELGLMAGGPNRSELDISDLPDGLYYLSASTPGRPAGPPMRFVKQSQ